MDEEQILAATVGKVRTYQEIVLADYDPLRMCPHWRRPAKAV